MASPVQPTPSHYHPSESAQEKQKLFELEWEINLLGAYLTASAKNNPLLQHVSNLKNMVATGKTAPSLIATEVNHLISQVNYQTGGGVVPLPPFESTIDNEAQALTSFAKTIEKVVKQFAENKSLPAWSPGDSLFKEGTELFKAISSGLFDRNPQEGLQKLNQLIEKINNSQNHQMHLQIPLIPVRQIWS